MFLDGNEVTASNNTVAAGILTHPASFIPITHQMACETLHSLSAFTSHRKSFTRDQLKKDMTMIFHFGVVLLDVIL